MTQGPTRRVPPAVLARLRLSGQRLVGSSFGTPLDAVRWMTAMQGQDLPGALWSVGLRVPGSTLRDVRAALDSGDIVRSWPMRGTLHLSAAEDLGWILALTSERMIAGMAGRHRQLEITTADIETARNAAFELLPASEASPGCVSAATDIPATSASRDEIFAAFRRAGQPTENQRGIHLLLLLSLTGTLVQGPRDGNTQKFVLLENWIRHPRVLERDEGLAELVLRYFNSHGPATVKDFCWWTKLTVKDATEGLNTVKHQLLPMDVDGSQYWMSRETADLITGRDLRPGRELPGTRSVLLLPGFDEFLLGYKDRSAALGAEHAPLIVPGNNGMFKPTVVTGGTVAGTWRRIRHPSGSSSRPAVVETALFHDLSPAQQRAYAKATAGYARFLAPAGSSGAEDDPGNVALAAG
ncbi:winged helix DNA-binding domain-containing protein [Arthrobacter sp. H14-L1]|uniref:winged helix DNA-binding domain-containing protein n=1 Tax=Arthrobacter sp. H14-L1 TaxID=2996697 RepID=UPI00226FFBB7|nr:winged helix DNA-binding domain-containing protein [Arthrobacter sp. H14-L1]MCY0904510.1 winged helix DNA-binding domain-containing protein [Arthrobacter sp. H14-L1]